MLRGPQGTIYGASGEAGIIRYVLREPSLTESAAQVGADGSWVQGGSPLGVAARMALDAPIVPDVIGLRISGFDRYTPGYIDETRLGVTAANDFREYGGRIAMLYRPLPPLSLKLSAIWYGINAASDTAVSSRGVVAVPNAGDAYIVAPQGSYPDLTATDHFLQPFSENLRLFSATVKWHQDSMDLDSVTAWSGTHTHYILDSTPVFGGVSGQPSTFDRYLYLGKFTEELRLVSPQGRRLDWYLGGYFDHEVVGDAQVIDDPVTLVTIQYPSWSREWAVFGDLTWRPATRLELTAGIRHAHTSEQQVSDSTYQGYPYFETPAPGPEAHTTWLLSAGFHAAPDVMLYARAATGYSQGGHGQIGRDGGLPADIRADTLTNYEIGLKSEFLGRRLIANLTAFYITRRNVLLGYGDYGPDFLTNSGAESTWNINGGAAIVRGLELEGFYSPLPGLKLGYSAVHTLAQITDPTLNVNGVPGPQFLAGYQLPNVPQWTAALAADYERQREDGWTLHAGATFRWVGWTWGSTDGVQSRSPLATAAIVLPGYGLLDLNAGLRKGGIACKAFVRNAANRRALLGGGVSEQVLNPDATAFAPVQVNYALAQPRTVGIGVDYSF